MHLLARTSFPSRLPQLGTASEHERWSTIFRVVWCVLLPSTQRPSVSDARERQPMRVRPYMLLAAAVMLNSIGCAAPMRAGANFDRGAEFPRYGTFAWDEPSERADPDSPLASTPLFESQLHGALLREFALRGIAFRGSAPGLLVRHYLSVVEEEILGPEPAMDPDYADEPPVLFLEEGYFSVVVTDASTGETLWTGWANGVVGGALRSPDRMQEWIDRSLGMMFEDFPIQAGGDEF